jgi:CheY-like chemotaxis protein
MTTTVQARPAKAILLVDDDHLVRASVSQMLTADDYRVIEAAGAQEALEIWRRCSNEIDLLMTDIRMPGMSGIELVEHLTNQEQKLKALYISGYPELLSEQAEVLRTVPLLQKPFTTQQISKKLRAILHRPLHGWKCPRCSGRSYRGLTADSDGKTLTLTYMCAGCELKRFTVLEPQGALEHCPFCYGPVVPAGYSYAGVEGYNLGSACYHCKATMRTYTPGCTIIPW